MFRKALLCAFLLYAAWLGMMAVHEAGHVLHAWVSGGVVDRVRIPLVGFSLTLFSVNPRPAFVAWGGPVWGCMIPLLAWAVLRPIRVPLSIQRVAQFFAGFCLIANGVYLGVGWIWHAGDAGDLLRLGTPRGAMIAFGIVCVVVGLALWHRVRWMSSRRGGGGGDGAS